MGRPLHPILITLPIGLFVGTFIFDLVFWQTANEVFVSTLSLGKIAELERPRRYPKAFGIPSNLLSGTPSSVACPPLRRMSGERSAFNV